MEDWMDLLIGHFLIHFQQKIYNFFTMHKKLMSGETLIEDFMFQFSRIKKKK